MFIVNIICWLMVNLCALYSLSMSMAILISVFSLTGYTKDYFMVYIDSCGRRGWRYLSNDYIDLACCTTSSRCLDFIF